MWNIGFCCRAAKVGKDGLSPIEMVITVDKVRRFRRLSIKVAYWSKLVHKIGAID